MTEQMYLCKRCAKPITATMAYKFSVLCLDCKSKEAVE